MAAYSVGHSNRSFDEFADILVDAAIDLVVDVRSFPRSRSNPVFNIDVLPGSLQGRGIAYEHWPDLGGRRKHQDDVPEDYNALWRNRSFHNYADYALSDPFQAALQALILRAQSSNLAMMCSEAVWWRCHRRIITDYLILRGHPVHHLMGNGRIEPAKVTLGAVLTDEDEILYPG